MEERRMQERRQISEGEFSQCPKYAKHDISEDQIKEIVKRIRDEDNRELGAFIREQGKGVIGKALLLAGLLAIGLYTWLQQQGIKVL